jgi:5'-nucleotidase
MARVPMLLVTLGAVVAVATPASAAPLRILVTNDDGVHAAGIDALTTALRGEPDVSVTVVAPATNESGTGGRATAGTLLGSASVTRSGYPAYAVEGTPADSVRYALDTLHVAPDLVISGINDGANLGPVADFSGTIGAARAAAALGLPALATSQGGNHPRFADGVAATIAWLRAQRTALVPGTVENLNTPTCRYAGKPAPTVAVQAATGLSIDFLRSLVPVVCPTHPPLHAADDVHAYLQGYSTLTSLPLL